jgi:hypothetical protein
MARQSGVPFIGRVGQLSFYHDKVHGHLVRTAGGPTKEQIQKKKSFAPVRKNNTAFGQASVYNRMLRGGFDPLLQIAKDYYTSRRLQGQLYPVLKAVQTQGILLEEALARGFAPFELLDTRPFARLFGAFPQLELAGKEAHVGSLLKPHKSNLKGVTHLQCTSCLVVVSLNWQKVVRDVQQGPVVKVGTALDVAQTHSVAGKGYLFYGVAVQCYHEAKGSIALVKDGPHCGFFAYGGVMK